jgi:rhodanese-related sulfurtransferase
MRGIVAIVLAVLGVTTFVACVRAAEDHRFPDISIKDLKSVMEKKQVTLIDANGTESYREGHIPGAVNFEADKDDLQKVLPKDKHALVVAYCGGPQCMAYKAAAAKAEELGYTNVKHLSAGISGWKEAGEKTEK